MARLKILFAVSECVPFAKAGGLGDVAGALPGALAARGHDVRVVMPRYTVTAKQPAERLGAPLGVPHPGGEQWCAVWQSELPESASARKVPVYLLEHDQLFTRDGIYNDRHGEFGDNLSRYAFLSRGALSLCKMLGFFPDVVHVHDWPTALVPVYLNLTEIGGPLHRAASVLSIHNMGYQGAFSQSELWHTGLGFDAYQGALSAGGHINLLKGGIVHATSVSTVSPTYAREIATPEGGFGLDGILRQRAGRAVGILNGIDESVWNPATDPHLPARFSAHDLGGKQICKAALQAELGLERDPYAPLIGVVSRLVEQKGIDLIAEALPRILGMGAQLAVLGSGERWAENLFRELSARSPRVGARIGFDEALAHRIEAGCDLFLMPSRYEPCGLNQMYSQRYGTLPIVRDVGGLSDTVVHNATGFKVAELSAAALVGTTAWAVHLYRADPPRFRAMQLAAMQKPMGWGVAARQYEALYRMAVARRLGRA